MFGILKAGISTDKEEIRKLLSRGVEEIFVRENLEKRLLSGKPLRIKLGIDPTSSKIHLGRAITLRKLRDFQRLGHKVVFIIGDFTARVGDPSDKLEKRPMLSKKQIEENLKDYERQAGKIIDLRRAEFHYNSKWLSKLRFEEIADLAESFSVQQMSNRRNFKDRLDKGQEISLREFLYPLMQGFDSVAVKADVELGGFDQLFNLKAGRVIQRRYGQTEQDILTTAMLSGTDGRKMSSSWGNVITIVDEPNDMFGKLMSVKDELIPDYMLLCTDLPEGEIAEAKAALASGTVNPRDLKIKLAKEVVKEYHGEKKAESAEADFKEMFSAGGAPKDIKEVKAQKGAELAEVLVTSGTVASKSEFRRLISENAISVVGGEKISDPKFKLDSAIVVKVGKHRFLKIVTE